MDDEQTGANDTSPGTPRVLVVEDHPDTLVMLGKMLSLIPVDAIPTATCQSARYAVQTLGGFDIVIADMTLPDGDGLELLSDLKERFGCATVAMSDDVVPDGGPPTGVDRWVTKPVDLNALRRLVRSLVKS